MPLDEDWVRRAKEARDRLERAQREGLQARAAFHDAVCGLHRAGGSLREIAEALDLSHQRVHQIVDQEPGLWARVTRRGRGRPRPVPGCSFCGRPAPAVQRLVAGPGIWICNQCIDLATRAVSARASQADGRARFDIGDPAAGARCAFCGKRRREVDLLAVSPAGTICNRCLDLCQEVLAEDRR